MEEKEDNMKDREVDLEQQNLLSDFQKATQILQGLNPNLTHHTGSGKGPAAGEAQKKRAHKLQKVLIDNRGEIAKRFFFALHEEGIPSVAVVTDVDRGQSWYEFADEVVYIGAETHYTNIPLIIAAAHLTGANAIYAGYGFLSENARFVKAIDTLNHLTSHNIIFMGPTYEVMQVMGDKVSARALARKHDVPMFEGSLPFRYDDRDKVSETAEKIGYPVIVKLSAGGGGKGMSIVYKSEDLAGAIESCCRIGRDLYNDDTYYIEKFIERPIHIEVQVFNGRAVGIRKCAVQRRNQKIIEESGFTFLDDHLALSFLSSAERLAVVSGYGCCGAGTVEFLIDDTTSKYGFMEMNTRLQVEYGVTDQSLGIDLVKWQILHFDGRGLEIVGLDTIKFKMAGREHAIECRIYAEEPENDYRPSPGTITKRDLPTFNGVRCDFGFGVGDKILSMYDPMIGKIIAQGATREEAIIRLERALQEFYIKGVKTNIGQLLKIVRHKEFRNLSYTNNLIKDHPELGYQKGAHDDAAGYQNPLIFGAFAEHIRLEEEAARQFKIIAAVKGIAHSDANRHTPHKYRVTFNNKVHHVEFLQTALDTYYAFVDSTSFGPIKLGTFNDGGDDLLVTLGTQSERIRVDHQLDCLVLRMRDRNSKVDYYRMTVLPEGVEQDDNFGAVRSPFQGSFVSFVREGSKVGDKVKKGDPLIILSAMKMETVMEAPCDGEISFIIENGDMSKLQLAKTTDGRVIGKSLKEGELLIKINPLATQSQDKQGDQETPRHEAKIGPEDTHGLLLYSKDYANVILPCIGDHFDNLAQIFYAMVQGFIKQQEVIDRMISLLGKVSTSQWKKAMTVERSDAISRIILHYTFIERLFSPSVSSEGFSFPEEFSSFIDKWPFEEMELSSGFEAILSDLLGSYGLESTEQGSDTHNMRVVRFFYLLKRSYDFCASYWDSIVHNINITGHLNPSSGATLLTLRRLLKETQKKLDDQTSDAVKTMIGRYFPKTTLAIDTLSDEEQNREQQLLDRFFGMNLWEKLVSALAEDELSQAAQALTPQPTGWQQEHLTTRLNFFKANRQQARKLRSPLDSSYVYELTSEKSRLKTFCSFLYMDFDGSLDFVDKAKDLVLKSSYLISNYQHVGAPAQGRIEIIIRNVTLSLDQDDFAAHVLSYEALKNICSPVIKYFHDRDTNLGVVEIIAPEAAAPAGQLYRIAQRNQLVAIDLMPAFDRNTPYYGKPDATTPDTQKLFDSGKWPIELWAEEGFDAGSIEEITLDTVDRNPEGLKVGSRIYRGRIHGSDAVFYMKDFRLMGGATGSYEGLKYSAATYLASLLGSPLYVFNDSAGANIKAGVVALNRGGQGFMMNSLMADNVSAAKFDNYTRHQFDADVARVFEEIRQRFGLTHKNRDTLIVAIGIGASAGLDVYGSSQATLQLILDAQTSYRVLTGSNVIKSVLGENISNYDIGGAQILGKWTGTVDVVAASKLELLSDLRKLHKLFYGLTPQNAISRCAGKCETRSGRSNSLVIDECLIHSNVDAGSFFELKGDYYGANALIAGFAAIGGKRVMVMGPRTDSGLTSTQAIIKLREVIKAAQRTETPQLLLFGAYLVKPTENVMRTAGMRAQLDLNRTLASGRGIRIHIITHVSGLEAAEANAHADAIIFVKKGSYTESDMNFIKMNSTFVVASLSEAFDRAQTLIHLITVRHEPLDQVRYNPTEKASIPKSKGQPYSMIESVIGPTFDDGSFVEFYREMNRPAGPFLITGLARLHGRSVAIIADQPEIKGGGADAPGAEKFRIFTELANKLKLPLIMLSNSSGFVPGSAQERLRIQAIGAESLDANILGEIPVVSVVLGQVYGGRQIQAFSRSLRPGIVYLAMSDALIAVMGETAAFDLLGTKTYQKLLADGDEAGAAAYRQKFLADFVHKAAAAQDATGTGVVDWTIDDVGTLREHLAKGLELAYARCTEAFARQYQ
jgi:acetyl/propionyl-CoA carboxylase alpha subunit/acetyl-CoA carboxylase carboxyltransferase component